MFKMFYTDISVIAVSTALKPKFHTSFCNWLKSSPWSQHWHENIRDQLHNHFKLGLVDGFQRHS